MKISVVTAVYNRAGSIGRAIESFNSQDWADKEHVFVDGGSSDATLEVIERLRQPDSTVISEPDKGIYDALNKGIAMASGDVIGLLHSDDFFADEGVLARIAKAFATPGTEAVYADAGFFRPGAPGRIVRRYDSSHFTPARIAYGWMPAHTTLFVRREVFDRFGLYQTDYQIAADFEFAARIFGRTPIQARYVPEIWMMMQTGGASTAGLGAKLVLNREVIRACRANGIRTSYVRILSKYPRKLLEFIGAGTQSGN